ncbi:amino acid ABC transporter substrate-binding protein [Thalassotalea sp. M1531]|uniref:Amino acid ABC transporter substrate-binding protein n=1 Tax=Thalassotalea algicola TaxID=2716224 RepID=A0A7Y0Q6S9_9GAMM|nr:transporter substrate-binding domain-containing protein [Thalassotalea algicola]NMP31728.1 amino acid ABC transporter substrate-binding protein [Thalassotalea algicola]
MFHFIRLILLFGYLSLSSYSVAYAKGQHIDVIAIEYPPFVTSAQDNYGFTFQLLSDYAQKHFIQEVKPLFLPPARAQMVIQSGKWCLSFYPPVDIEKRFFIPLSEQKVKLSLYRLREPTEFRWNSLEELKGKKVAILRSNQHGRVAKKYLEAGMKLVPVESISQGLNMLLYKRVDYWAAAEFVLDSLIVEETIRDKLQFAQTAIHEFPIGIFYNPDCAATLFK